MSTSDWTSFDWRPNSCRSWAAFGFLRHRSVSPATAAFRWSTPLTEPTLCTMGSWINRRSARQAAFLQCGTSSHLTAIRNWKTTLRWTTSIRMPSAGFQLSPATSREPRSSAHRDWTANLSSGIWAPSRDPCKTSRFKQSFQLHSILYYSPLYSWREGAERLSMVQQL